MPDSSSSRFATAIADAFGLGRPIADLQPVNGGRSHLMWRLHTEDGEWAVKALNRSREAWWMNGYHIAAQIEQTAWDGGIAMPRPVHPANPIAPLLTDITVADAVFSVRAHEWCDGQALDDASPEVLQWVGETLAAVHALPIGLDVTDAVIYEPHELHEWQRWLNDAPSDVPTDFLTAVRTHLPDVAQAKEIVDQDRAGMRDRLTPVFTHRDIKPDNVLLTTTNPVLVDWDEAGLDFAEWEVIRAALAFSRDDNGWNHRRFDQVLRTYQAVSGRKLPAERGCFAGVLRHQIMAAAFLLFRALGYRPVTPAERAAAYGHAHEFLTDLRVSLQRLPEWTHWLQAATER